MTEGFSAEAGTGSAVRKSDQGNVPKLRFPGFAGEWRTTPFNKVFSSVPTKNFQVFSSSFLQEGKFPIVDQGIDLIAGYSNKASKVFNKIPVVVFGDHTTVLKYIDFPFVVGADGTKVLSVNGENAQFAYFSLLAAPIEQEGYKRHYSILKDRTLVFPTLPEQQKIAAFLGAVDARLAALAARQAALGRFKAGLMQKLFSQQLRFTRDDGGAFPDWEEYPFEKIAFRTRSAFNPQKSREKPTLIELENIEGGTGKIVGHSDLEGQISLKSVFQAGDVLFGKLRPYLRKYAQPNFDGVCSSEIWVMRGRKVSNAFLFHLVQSSQFIQVANISTGSKMPRSDWSTIADTGFEIPHPDEQAKIANALTTMDAKIQAVADQATKLQTFKKGLLQQMFV